MTVKCLTPADQRFIALSFQSGSSIDSLAEWNKRSRRTIIRVLEDAGVDAGIKRRNRKPKPITGTQLALAAPVEFNMEDLKGFPTFNEPKSLFQRVKQYVVGLCR